MKTRVITIATVLVGLLFATIRAEAVGSGGLLNLVPQAQVWMDIAQVGRQPVPYKVFVHPMEGSLVLVRDGDKLALALDKNKRHAVEMARDRLMLSADGTILDVPENTPVKVLAHAPHFNRTFASLRLDANRVLVVSVTR